MLHLAQRLFHTPLAIHPAKYEVIVNGLGPRLFPELDFSAVPPAELSRAFWEPNPSAGGDELPEGAQQTDAGYTLTPDGIAVIPVRGTLVKKSSFADATSGLQSYARIASQFSAALKNPDVRGILLDINSPGGETHGMFDLADTIYSARGDKPIYAVANDAALSAAYLVASAADKIFVTRTGAVGSVGVFSCHIDQSGADEKKGLTFTYVYSGAKKINGNPHAPLSEEAKDDAQEETDRQYGMFVDAVARNRGASARQIAGTKAGVFTADSALPLLADGVGNLGDAYQSLVKKSGGAKPMLVTVTGSGKVAGLLPITIPQKEAAAMPVIPYAKTAVVRQTWSASANRKNLRAKASQTYYERAHAYRDADLDPTTKNAYTFIHHEVGGNGNVGAANLTACSSGIGILNGGRGGQGRETYTPSERRGIYRHLAQHQKDGGEDPAPLTSYQEYLGARLALGLIPPTLAGGLHQYLSAHSGSDLLAEYAFEEGDDPMAKTAVWDEEEVLRQLAAAAAAEAADPDGDDPDEEEDPDKDKRRGKKGKKAKKGTAAAAAPKDKDPDDDDDDDDPDDPDDDDDDAPPKKSADLRVTQIMNLCNLAGQPLSKALGFVNKGYSVAQVIRKLGEQRAARSNAPEQQIEGYGTVRTSAVEQFILGPQRLAREKNISIGAATELLLRANPQAYEQYVQEKLDATGIPGSSTAKAYAEQIQRLLSQAAGKRQEILLRANTGDAARG